MTTLETREKIGSDGESHTRIGQDTSTQGILEFLETNAKWWGEAALACESRAAQLPSGEREALEWQLQAAVYDERTRINARFIERRRKSPADGDKPGVVTSLKASNPGDSRDVKTRAVGLTA